MRRADPLLALLCACVPVDRRPPFARPSYASDVEAIHTAGARAPRGRGPYRAGWSRIRIEAPNGVPLAGYGEREGAPSEGVKDPAYVRAFAIEAGRHRIVLLTADLLLLDEDTALEIRARLKDDIDPTHLFFTASHTHSGPGGYADGVIWKLVTGPYDPSAFEAVVAAHVRAVQEAIAELEPARIGSSSRRVPGLVKNRTERNGPIDDRLFVLRFEKKNGSTALFWSFGCHAVTLGAKNMKISADYPGSIARALEGLQDVGHPADAGGQRREGSIEVVGFAAGGVGSANPIFERGDDAWLVERLKTELGKSLDDARTRSRAEGTLASSQIDRPAPQLQYRATDELGIWEGAIDPFVGDRMRFGAIAVGDTVLVHLPSEPSTVLTRRARARARRHGIELAVLPFNGTYLGYVTPRRIYDLPEERGEELLFYETHTMSFLGAWGGDLMINLGLRLAAGVRFAEQSAR